MKSIPKFKIEGTLDSAICNINKPFTGELLISESETTIKSIELQLVRVETCGKYFFLLFAPILFYGKLNK